jgi:hypothetical protein
MSSGFNRVYKVPDYSSLSPNQKKAYNANLKALTNKLPPGGLNINLQTEFNTNINKGNLYNSSRLLFNKINRNNRNLLINKLKKYNKPYPGPSNTTFITFKNGQNANTILRNAARKGRINEIIAPYYNPQQRANYKQLKLIWGVGKGFFDYSMGQANRKLVAVGRNGKVYGFALLKNLPTTTSRKATYIDTLGAMKGYGSAILGKVVNNSKRNQNSYVGLRAVVSYPTKKKNSSGKLKATSNENTLTKWYVSQGFERRGNMVKNFNNNGRESSPLQPMVKYIKNRAIANADLATQNQINNIKNQLAVSKAAKARAGRRRPPPLPLPPRLTRSRARKSP